MVGVLVLYFYVGIIKPLSRTNEVAEFEVRLFEELE